MARFEDICALGGAEGPSEQILECIGGDMPGGPEGSPEDIVFVWVQVAVRLSLRGAAITSTSYLTLLMHSSYNQVQP